MNVPKTRLGLLLFLLSSAACHKVTIEDAKASYAGVLSVGESAIVFEPDQRRRALYQLCSEIKSCAAGCEQALSFCASRDSEEAQRTAMLADCYGEAKRARDADKMKGDEWFEGYLARYIDKTRPLVPEQDRRRYDGATRRLKLLK